MDTSIVDFSCGVHSIDEQIKEAYYKTLFKQAVAYYGFVYEADDFIRAMSEVT